VISSIFMLFRVPEDILHAFRNYHPNRLSQCLSERRQLMPQTTSTTVIGLFLFKNVFRWNSLNNRLIFVRFEVFTAVTTKNAVFWFVTPVGCCKNRRFGRKALPPSSGRQ
jgi:hypothetical protein